MYNRTKILSVLILILALSLAACSGVSASQFQASAGLNKISAQAEKVSALQAAVSQAAVSQAAISQPAPVDSELVAAYQGTLEQIYAAANPSVVNVEVLETASIQPSSGPFGFNGGNGLQSQSTALGSGFIWDTQGHIVTNNHVVENASQVRITFADGASAKAKVVGTDPSSDLAVLQVDVDQSKLKPVALADSSQVKVGQMAIAIGNPYGLSGTMTVGVISGLNRSLAVRSNNLSTASTGSYSIPDIVQTDASINPGNSGGVLLNDQGELIGVTTAIASESGSNSGVGFVIPSAIVQQVVPALIESGHYDHPWLGISGTSLTPDLAKANDLDEAQLGVLVVSVTGGSPADKAGLVGAHQETTAGSQSLPTGSDVIVAVDGQPVERFEDLISYLSRETTVGQTIKLEVLRSGQSQTISLTLGARPATGN